MGKNIPLLQKTFLPHVCIILTDDKIEFIMQLIYNGL